MNVTDQLLAALVAHGLPVLFGVMVICCIGAPLPTSLMLAAAGSFVRQGEMRLWPVLAVAIIGALIGDQIGYGLARWGGHRLIVRISRRVGGEARIQKAEALSRRWGGAGIFFSRWLVTGLGPWINVTSGIAEYPWHRFLLWDILGEALWVVLYVTLGYIFSDRVQEVTATLGNFAWVIFGVIVAIVLGWQLLRSLKRTSVATAVSQ